jgi:hypothetical protein
MAKATVINSDSGKVEAKPKQFKRQHVTQRVKNSHFLLEQKAKYEERIGSLYQPTKSGLDRGGLPANRDNTNSLELLCRIGKCTGDRSRVAHETRAHDDFCEAKREEDKLFLLKVRPRSWDVE